MYSFNPHTERSLEDYRRDILDHLEGNGTYTHNIVSLTLRIVNKAFGKEAVEKLIKECELTKKLGIVYNKTS